MCNFWWQTTGHILLKSSKSGCMTSLWISFNHIWTINKIRRRCLFVLARSIRNRCSAVTHAVVAFQLKLILHWLARCQSFFKNRLFYDGFSCVLRKNGQMTVWSTAVHRLTQLTDTHLWDHTWHRESKFNAMCKSI